MSENFLVRPVLMQEIGEVVALLTCSIAANMQGFRVEPDEKHDAFIERVTCLQSKKQGVFLVGIANGQIVGCGALGPIRADLDRSGAAYPEIARLHVAAPYLGQGIGRKILLELVHTAHKFGHDGVQLHVTATQTKAINLYQRNGFHLVDQQVFTLEDGRAFPTMFFLQKF